MTAPNKMNAPFILNETYHQDETCQFKDETYQ